ncbi:MAG: hypothetical protein LBE81_12550 [Azonexus sp.]|jgi:hypothetical protein|uniref:hypothetical protein n=1 Tax=Azonexus sp. TaxID=1872668 RepID=UPI0028293EE6|nr:hypothetical protein [Azonexus sp.]MDR0777448.1 hypothetical protein [Azonexus sp.]
MILETSVGRARAGCHRVGWQGTTTQQARACKEEQRRQRARWRPAWVCSDLTHEVKAIEAWSVNVHTTSTKKTSGQLRFPG